MPGADGHITLKVNIDQTDVKKGVGNISDAVKKLTKKLSITGSEVSKSFSDTKGLKELQRELDSTNKRIEKTKAKLEELQEKYNRVAESADRDSSGKRVYSKSDETKLGKWDTQLVALEGQLEKDENRAKELGETIKNSTTKALPGVTALTSWFDAMGKKMLTIFRRVFVFSLLYKVLYKLLDIIKTVAMGDEEFRKSLSQLKTALWTIGTPILNSLIPALKTLVNWLTQAVVIVGKFYARMTGRTYSSMVNNAKTLKSQADAYKNIGKSVKDTNKQLADFDDLQILASGNSGGVGVTGALENISKLTEIGMITGWALVGLGIILMFSGHPFIGIGMVATGYAMVQEGAMQASENMGEKEKQKLATIGTTVGLSMIGLGVLLLFTKKAWKYGLYMIATGAMAVYTAYTLGGFSVDVKTKISEIIVLSGIVAFTLGVLLLFVKKPDVWKYGLDLMCLGVTEVAVGLAFGGEELKAEIQTFVIGYWKELYAIGVLMVVVGVFLLFANAKLTWKYALTLIAYGIGIVVGTTYFGGDELKSEIETFIATYWKEIYAISALIVVVGIVLLFLKQWKYGITLVVAGIVTLVTATYLGGDELKAELTSFVDTYWKEIYAISALIVVIGAVLLFVPGCWGYGLALIAAGIIAITTATSLASDEIKTELTTTVGAFKDEIMGIGTMLFVLGVILLFIPGCWGYGLTLLGLGAAALYGSSKLSSKEIGTQLTTELDNLNNSARTGVNKINNTLSGIKLGSGAFGSMNFPALPKNGYARGTVVPPNTPHLAWFGDNKQEPEIVSPISTMKQAFTDVMLEMGGIGQTTKEEYYYLGETELMRIIYKLVKGGERIEGNSLVTGGMY